MEFQGLSIVKKKIPKYSDIFFVPLVNHRELDLY